MLSYRYISNHSTNKISSYKQMYSNMQNFINTNWFCDYHMSAQFLVLTLTDKTNIRKDS